MATVNTGLTSGICNHHLVSHILGPTLVRFLWSRAEGVAIPLYLHAAGLEDCIEGSQAMKIVLG